MPTRRFTTTVVAFGALAASLMVLPGVLDASSSANGPVPQGGVGPAEQECADNGFPGTMGVKDETPGNPNPEVFNVTGGTIVITYSQEDEGEFFEVTVTSTGTVVIDGIVVKAGQTDLTDGDPPFVIQTEQGISHVTVCYTTGTPPPPPPPPPPTTTTTTIPATTTTTTIPATTTTSISPTTSIAATTTTAAATTTTAAATTTTAAGTTTTAAQTTTTAANESTTTAPPTTGASTTTILPPPPNTGTLPNTGSGGSSNVIAIAVLALLGGALALVIARRRAI